MAIAVFFVFHTVTQVHAANGIRKTINFQGKLVDQNGLNVPNGSYTVVFTLYDDPSAGSNLWDETQSVTTTDGVFQVELGTVDTTLGNVNFNSDLLYLGIKVGTDAEMTPRIRFTAVPYAFNAQKVNGLNVTNESGNPFNSTTTFRIADGKTVQISNGLTLAGTDSTTITFQGTDTYVGRATTDTLTNKTIGSTGLTFSGATLDVTTVSNEDLTFSTDGSGDLILNTDFDSGVSIGSSGNTPAVLSVSGGLGANAALILNQTNSGDILAASSAGATRFRIANNGDLVLSSGINLSGTVGTGTQCLLGGAVATWGSCGSSGGGNGADLVQGTGTLTDTILGATSTLLGTVTVTPTTASGDIWVQAQLWTRSLNATDQTLTFEIRSGANCSGGLLDSETSLLTSANGANGPAGFVSYVETNAGTAAKTYAICALTTTASGARAGGLATATVIDTNAGGLLSLLNGAYVLGNSTADFLYGSTATNSALFKFSPVGTGPVASVSANTSYAGLVVNNNGFGDLLTASKSGATKFTVLNSGDLRLANYTTGGGFLYTNTTGTVLQTTAGNNGECLKSAGGGTPTWGNCSGASASYWDLQNGLLYNGNLSVDFAIGGNTSTSAKFRVSTNGTEPTASISGNTGKASLIIDNAGFGDLLTASKSGATKFTVLNSGNIQIANYTTSGGFLYTNTTGTVLQTLAGNSGECLKSAGGSTPTWGACSGASAAYWDLQNGLLYTGNVTTDFAVGGNSSISAKFRVSSSGMQPTASVSGNTAKAALVVDNTGFGDLFTASKSGATKFTVLNSGDLRLANYITGGGFLYTNTTGTVLQTVSGNSGECLKSAGGSTPTWGACSGASAAYWDLQNGLLYNGNLTTDFAIGGNSTQSAEFRVSTNGTQSTASVSGNTAKASLIVDNTGFGDLLTASKSGATKFTVLNSGDVRINNLLSCDVKTDASGLLTCGTDATGAGGTNYLQLSNGTFSFINNTADVLIGGTSTASAKFVFGGLNTNNATATFAGDLMFKAEANSSQAEQTAWRKVSNATAGTIASGGTTQIASISAMTAYNGNLYVGTFKPLDQAEVYRYDMINTTWTKVSQTTAGTIANGGTSGIASVSAMTVYDGRLYVGTSKMNQAEVYRYDGGTTWTRVSSTTAGTIATGGTSGIDGISSMAVYNGSIYVGTSDGARAEIYRYNGGINWTKISNTTAGTLVTTNSVNVQAVTSLVVRNGILYAGLKKNNDADVVRYEGGTTFLQMNSGTTASTYTINGTAVSNYDEVTAMTVFNGNLVVALRNDTPAGFELLMLSGGSSGTAVDSWSRLNNAAGQMVSGGTSGIPEVTALTVYNGMLYAATRSLNGTEIYRYTGGDQKWMKVSQAAGTIDSNGSPTTAIDGVTAMVPVGSDLYAGTQEILRAEVYKLTDVNLSKSYALKFNATSPIVGEQGSANNIASIFYLASASANLGSAAGNSGAFIFSHGIQTRNGSYDVAEDYPTRDDSLEPGEVVSIDTNERGFVKKSQEAYDPKVLGVYSEKPALRLSQDDAQIDGAKAIPVALAGRVPVKVSTENGEIAAGDFLTASSQPGVAMRATKSGVVIGQAMGGFACEDGELVCTGKVLTYIKSASYLGSIASEFAGLELKEKPSGQELLAAVRTQAYTENTVVSEIVTDQLVAGLRIVSPEITADKLQITTIASVEKKDIGIVLGEAGTLTIQNASSAAGIAFKGSGDAYFAGQVQAATLSAEKLIVKQIDIPAEAWKAAFAQGGLESIESRITAQEARLTNLETLFASQSAVATPTPIVSNILADMPAMEEFEKPKADDSFATFSGKLSADKLQVAGSAIIEGILHVVDFITTRTLIVDDLATFLGKVVFSGEVTFEDHPTFNTDTAGIAIVKKGTDRIEVRFEKEYKAAPMVNVNLTLDEVSPMPGEAIENLVRRQEAQEDRLFGADVRYIVTKRTAKGFVILLDKKADEDVAFSWIVVAVDNPLVHSISGDNSPTIKGQKDENTRPISSGIPTVIPTSSIEKREVEILPSPKELLDGKEVSTE